jgi:bifunctional DNase/RNase
MKGGGGMVKVDVVSVGMDKKINAYVALLQVRQGERTLPIFIGAFEAGAISVAIEQVRSPRPLVHDLLRSMVEGLGGRVERVDILGMEADYYVACVELVTREGRHVRVDARPSDAVALALRSGASIFVADEVLERSGVFLRKEGEAPKSRGVGEEKGERGSGRVGEREKKEASRGVGEESERAKGRVGERESGRKGRSRAGEKVEDERENKETSGRVGEWESGGKTLLPFSHSGCGEGRGERDRLLARLRWLVREEAYEAAAEVRDRIGGGIEAERKIEKKYIDMS